MSDGIGTLTKFGIRPATAWGTAASLVANCLVKSREVSPLTPQQDMLQDETHSGTIFPEQVDEGLKNAELNFSGDLRYENAHWFHIVQLIGTDTVTGTSSPYTHTVPLAEDPTNYYTAAALVDDLVFEWPSVKPQSFEISIDDNGVATFNCSGIANDVLLGSDATNDATSIGTTATFDTEELRCLVGHLRIRMNNQADGALDATDNVYGRCTIALSRPYVREFLSRATGGITYEHKTSEPQQDGMLSDITLTLDFPELSALTYLENFQDQQLKKAEVYFYRDATYSLKFEFPCLNPIQPDVSANTPGRIPQSIVYQALKAPGTGPTGMVFTAPMKMTLTNGQSNAYHNNT